MVADPEAYPWSGHRAYLGKESLPWLTTEWLSGQFGRSLVKARSGYQNFVLAGLGEERRAEFHGTGLDSRLLGDDHFMDRCLAGQGERLLRLPLQAIVAAGCDA